MTWEKGLQNKAAGETFVYVSLRQELLKPDVENSEPAAVNGGSISGNQPSSPDKNRWTENNEQAQAPELYWVDTENVIC